VGRGRIGRRPGVIDDDEHTAMTEAMTVPEGPLYRPPSTGCADRGVASTSTREPAMPSTAVQQQPTSTPARPALVSTRRRSRSAWHETFVIDDEG
jgi:hypothetical protein